MRVALVARPGSAGAGATREPRAGGTMSELKAVSLDRITQGIRASTRPVSILWQEDDTLAFVARGREHRSEFHSDPVDEVMYMITGDMRLHYRTPEGEEKVAVVREGDIIHCPAGVPHSPRFSPDAFVLVLERKRRAEERDAFTWFCAKCGSLLYQSIKHVADYNADPVSRVYEEFYNSETHRTCLSCGHITPRPDR
jgi:3-hydroxyanthranilate 3,4-dioxygenase